MSKKKFIAYENVFDENTLRALFKLSSQGYFDRIESPISTGKESNVFTVIKGKGKRVVKIYRTAANFKKMMDYMKPDPRFANVKGSKLTIVFAWARKEFRNLHKAKVKNVTCPTPYAVNKNVLVMKHIDAKQLLYHHPKDPKKFYEKLIKEVKKLYDARLIHTDISEYNILNYKDKPILIDFSHAVDLRYPNSKGMLKRDIRNMVRFFNKLGLDLNEKEELERIWQDKR